MALTIVAQRDPRLRLGESAFPSEVYLDPNNNEKSSKSASRSGAFIEKQSSHGNHELKVAWSNASLMSHKVLVLEFAFYHICKRAHSAVGMICKQSNVSFSSNEGMDAPSQGGPELERDEPRERRREATHQGIQRPCPL